jgi:hypothetical protein
MSDYQLLIVFHVSIWVTHPQFGNDLSISLIKMNGKDSMPFIYFRLNFDIKICLSG